MIDCFHYMVAECMRVSMCWLSSSEHGWWIVSMCGVTDVLLYAVCMENLHTGMLPIPTTII